MVTRMQRIPAVGAVVVDELGRLLLVQRGAPPQRGCWSVPGGAVEPGETLAEAAAREVREETGLIVEIGRELWCVDVPIDADRVYEVHDFLAAPLPSDPPEAPRAGDDAADARWCTRDDLDRLPLTSGLRELLDGAGLLG